MPWKVKSPVDLRAEFIRRLHAGERMTDLCREYGIARKTGHKLANRVRDFGSEGLRDRSRAPKNIPHKTKEELVKVLIAFRGGHESWGPRKIKEALEREHGHKFPSASTIGTILENSGLVVRRRRKRCGRASETTLREAMNPNEVWCIDYKGQFRLGDGSYCYPLTMTDNFSRFILCCEGMAAIDGTRAREETERVFQKWGLPAAIRSDNGTPFSSNSVRGLSKLSVYWLRLGIALERIRPAHPEENGRHERMHRTLKKETTRPARANLLQQQERFDEFVDQFNNERPHEALAMKRPADVHESSTRQMPDKLAELTYPMHDDAVRVRSKGLLYFRRHLIHVSDALEGEFVGLREEDNGSWLVTFMNMDLGHIRDRTFEPLDLSER